MEIDPKKRPTCPGVPNPERLSVRDILITRPADFSPDDYDRSFVWMQYALRQAQIDFERIVELHSEPGTAAKIAWHRLAVWRHYS